MISAHRMTSQMMGMVPNNTGGFGDVVKATEVYARNEFTLLQEKINEKKNGFVVN